MPSSQLGHHDDTSSTTFTTASTALTPGSSPTDSGDEGPLDILDADPMTSASSSTHRTFLGSISGSSEVVPWPGKTFLILQKGTTNAITLTPAGQVRMQPALEHLGSGSNRWMCVEQNGYFGFYNTQALTYLGHDNKGHVTAAAKKLQGWELVTARRHPEGGFQLLSPHWAEALYSINVVEGSGQLVRVPHGDTLWEFEVV